MTAVKKLVITTTFTVAVNYDGIVVIKFLFLLWGCCC